jgi:hypothetical protein
MNDEDEVSDITENKTFRYDEHEFVLSTFETNSKPN